MRSCCLLFVLLLASPAGAADGVMITGRAILADGRTPWVGARVSLHAHDDCDAAPCAPGYGARTDQGATDRRGQFHIAGVLPGSYTLVVESAPSVRTLTLTVGRSSPAPLVLRRGTGVVEVAVVWQAEGPPVAGAEVSFGRTMRIGECTQWFGEVKTRTDARGRCRFTGLEAGEYGIGVIATQPASGLAYQKGRGVALPAAGRATEATLVMKPFTVDGVVLNAEGRPAEAALLALGHIVGPNFVLEHHPEEGKYLRTTRADADGRFSFPNVGISYDDKWAHQGEYWLYARGSDGTEALRAVEVDGRGVQDAPFTLHLSNRGIEGSVRTLSGRPVAGVLVTVTPPPGTPPERDFLRFRTRTDAEGRLRFFDLAPGTYGTAVHVGAQGDPGTQQPILVDEAWRTHAEIVVPETQRVSGVLVYPDGRAAAGARVMLNRRSMETDQQGRFDFGETLPGRYSLFAGHRNVPIVVPADRPPDPLRVVVPASQPRLLLDVRRPDGHSAAGSEVYVYTQRQVEMRITWAYASALTTNGHFELKLEDVEEGKGIWTWVLAPGLGWAMPKPIPVSGLAPVTRAVVRLQPGAMVRGRAVEDGRPAPGVLIVPHQEKGSPGADRWNPVLEGLGPHSGDTHYPTAVAREKDGSFVLGPLPPGHYALELVDSIRGVNQTLNMTLADGEQHTGVVLKVPPTPNPTALSGRVVTPECKPVARQRVYFRVKPTESATPLYFEFFEDPGQLREVVTDAAGRFRLDPLPATRVNLIASRGRHPRGGGIIVDLKPGNNPDVELLLQDY